MKNSRKPQHKTRDKETYSLQDIKRRRMLKRLSTFERSNDKESGLITMTRVNPDVKEVRSVAEQAGMEKAGNAEMNDCLDFLIGYQSTAIGRQNLRAYQSSDPVMAKAQKDGAAARIKELEGELAAAKKK